MFKNIHLLFYFNKPSIYNNLNIKRLCKLCTPKEIADTLGVSNRNIQRYTKTLKEKGTDWFFHKSEKMGDAHKLTKEMLKDAQEMNDNLNN